jgi:hypothetical protein
MAAEMPKFAKGQARPPNSGRGKGTPNKSTAHRRRLMEAINANDKAIIDKVIQDARNGDHSARHLYFRYLRPMQRPETFLDPAEYKTPTSAEEARAMIFKLSERLTKGDISLEMHDALVDDLCAYLTDKAAEQQRELDRLKESLSDNGHD